MKKITLVLSLFAMSLFMVACGATDKNETPKNDPVVEDSNDQSTNDMNQAEDDGLDDEADTETTNRDDSNADDSTSNIGDDEVAKMEQLDYIDFDLSVEYGSHEEYEAELELKTDNRVEAEIEDDMNGVKVKGQEAFDELYPLVEKLTITQDTPKGDAIEEVLNVFELDADYTEFELDIKFKDGTKIEFKDKK